MVETVISSDFTTIFSLFFSENDKITATTTKTDAKCYLSEHNRKSISKCPFYVFRIVVHRSQSSKMSHPLLGSSFFCNSCRFQTGMDSRRFSSNSRCRSSSASRLAFSAALRANICRFQSGMTAPVTSLSGI
jgi:hypothetical protein